MLRPPFHANPRVPHPRGCRVAVESHSRIGARLRTDHGAGEHGRSPCQTLHLLAVRRRCGPLERLVADRACYTLLDREPLRFVDCERKPCNQWKLFPSHARAFFHAQHGQDRHPLRLILVENWPTIFRHFDNQILWKNAKLCTLRVDRADQLTARAISEATRTSE